MARDGRSARAASQIRRSTVSRRGQILLRLRFIALRCRPVAVGLQ